MSAEHQPNDHDYEAPPNLAGDGHSGGEGGEEEIWLISYADLMTLLFTFFVVMYAAAAASKGGNIQAMKESLAQYFGGGKEASPFEELKKTIIEAVKNDKLLYDLETRATLQGLELTFSTTVVFATGSADLLPETTPAMKNLVEIIKKSAPNNIIRVEGHTDDAPIVSNRFPSNWELSGSRASTIIRLFEQAGFDPKNLTAIGFSSTRPRFPNRDEKGAPISLNRAKNRRVVIKVIQPRAFYEPSSEDPVAH